MLKIWKNAWKKQDSSSKPQSGRDSDQEDRLSGTSSGLRTSTDASAAAPPNTGDSVLVPVEPNDSVKKRSRIDDTSSDPEDRVPKIPRLGIPDSRDSLGNVLPEMAEDDDSESRRSRIYAEIFEEEILEHVRKENTIGLVASVKCTSLLLAADITKKTSPPAVTKIICQFLTWAVDVERSRLTRTVPRARRTALVVIDDDNSVENQASDLASNCSLKIATYLEPMRKGDINPWSNLLEWDVVIVSASHFLDSLLRGILAISQLHALVTTDAQLVRDQDSHPMVRVMDEFYRVTDPLCRPKILAMATPPSDRQFHYDSGMLKLENTLDAKVFGVSSERRTEILAIPDRPSETVVLYNPPLRTAETRLFKVLIQLDPEQSIFPHQFSTSQHVLTEVGSCASDLVWRRALKDIDASVTPVYEEEDDGPDKSRILAAKARINIRDTVKNWSFAMPNLHANAKGFNVTPKFLKLVQILKSCEPYGDGFRGIVFVKRRATALVIVDLLRMLSDIGFIRPYALVGHDALQQRIFRAFGKGSYNLLVATKCLEDLEVPKAHIVIRFDLFESHVSNAYVRGRTRGRESHIVFMIERGNDVQRRILSQVTQLDTSMRRWTESVSKGLGGATPPKTLRESTDPYCSESEDDEEDFILDPTTSGRIRLQDATTVIYRFAARLGTPQDFTDTSLFEFKELDIGLGVPRAYECTVVLPLSPLRRITGSPCTLQSLARRSASYQACLELFNLGLLDYTLFPLPPKVIRSATSILERNAPAEPETKSAGVRCYPKKRPDFWPNTVSVPLGGFLYPTVISTDHSNDPLHFFGPMVILTRRPLPHFPSYNLFFSGVPAVIHLIQAAPLSIGDERLRDIYMYTTRVCRAISNRPFTCPLERMPYFFAPLRSSWSKPISSGLTLPNINDHILWDLVSLAAKTWVVALQTESAEKLKQDIQDAVIQDRWVEFTRRYEAVRIRQDLSPLSKPADSPRERDFANLVEYCKARRKGFEGLQECNQPLIEVSKVPGVINRLNPASRPLTASTKHPAKYLIPELCAKFTIPASTLRTALLLPSITRRIDDLLVVKELNAKLFDHAIMEEHLHPAISAPSSGAEYDYERLELLGDAFLKYLSSIYVFVTNPALHEGALHVVRQHIISNKSLHQNAIRVGLPSFIQSKPFTIKLWQPPNFLLVPTSGTAQSPVEGADDDNSPDDYDSTKAPGYTASDKAGAPSQPDSSRAIGPTAPSQDAGSESPLGEGSKSKKRSKKKRQQDEQNFQWFGDKVVADVAEAIIGAAYISGGREGALKATKALQIPIPNIDRWSDFSRKVLAPPPAVTAKLRPGSIEAVEEIIGHKFNRPHLLAQALTHASIQNHEATSYERLEFIGDAILDFLVIRHIFDRDGKLSPGALTLLKGAMVSNSALAAVCVSSGLQEHLLFESYALASNMESYVDELKTKQAQEYGLAAREGRLPGQYWLEIEPPKALSDVVESIIGAIYISDDFSPVGTEALFDNLLKPFYDHHITLKTLSHHPTKILFELFQAQGCQSFEIVKSKDEVRQVTRCDVVVHDVILASATDATATFAARRASLYALDALEGDAQFLMRTCDCRTHAKKSHKRMVKDMLAGFSEEDEEMLIVEGVLAHANRNQSEEPD